MMARDKAQVEEIKLNVELANRTHDEGVQVIIEGMGGHVRADRIAEYVKFHKQMSQFPLFVAGPLPTDVAVGYDHIAGSVGASIASGAGLITCAISRRLSTLDSRPLNR